MKLEHLLCGPRCSLERLILLIFCSLVYFLLPIWQCCDTAYILVTPCTVPPLSFLAFWQPYSNINSTEKKKGYEKDVGFKKPRENLVKYQMTFMQWALMSLITFPVFSVSSF